MRKLSIAAIALVSLSCGSKHLTRDEAAMKISSALNAQRTASVDTGSICVCSGCVAADSKDFAIGTPFPIRFTDISSEVASLETLRNLGLISATMTVNVASDTSCGLTGQRISVGLTEKGKTRSDSWTKTGSRYSFVLSRQQFDGVTGVAEDGTGKNTSVEYTWHWDLTDEGRGFGYSSASQTGTARFTLYDDGWRLDPASITPPRNE